MYVEKEKYNNLTVDSSYSDFMERFHPLSGTDVEGNQPPAEKKLSWKQRKRRNKMFKEWYQLKVDDAKVIPRLVFAEDLKKMEMFSSWDKKDREHWEKQVLPHSKLTRGETLRRIIEEGDYSNFENLDELMRNRVATLTHVPDLITVTSYYRKKKSKDPSGDAADAEHYGSMLMGLESDAAGVMNQMGHTHDMFATPEKASSLGAQRTDEEGEKYGGRQCDLTAKSAGEIAYVLIALEKKMLQWQRPRDLKSDMGQPEDMGSENAKQLMRLLAGKKMGYQEWQTFDQIVGIPRNIYGKLVL